MVCKFTYGTGGNLISKKNVLLHASSIDARQLSTDANSHLTHNIYTHDLTFYFNQKFIREIAKKTLNKYIYLDFLGETEVFLSTKQLNFFKSFTQKDWSIFYEENIHRDVIMNDFDDILFMTLFIKNLTNKSIFLNSQQ